MTLRAPVLMLALAALLLATPTDAARVRLFSYDPTTPETRQTAGGLTFQFAQHLTSINLLRVFATEGQASADLQPARDQALGPGGLSGVIGARAPERALYQVAPGREGTALIDAFCPGSERAWMAFGRIKANKDLRVYVLGAAANGPSHLCHQLDFSFRGEWRGQQGLNVNSHTFDAPRDPFH